MSEAVLPMPRNVLLAIALGCIALQFGGSLPLSALSLVIWLATLAVASPRHLRRLWMPRFWAISLVFALGSGLLLGKPDLSFGPIKASSEGLAAGVLMLVRGAFLFALMGWASKLIADQQVRRGLRKVGLAKLGDALASAFDLLPSFIDRVKPALSAGKGTGLGGRATRLHALAVDLVCHAARTARELDSRPRPAFVAAVIGPRGSGKTTTLHRILERLRAEGLQVGGVTQPAIHEGEQRIGYRLRDEATGEEIPFAKKRAEHGFSFADEGWRWSRERLAQALSSADVVVLDELGKLEAEGQGHLRSLTFPEGSAAMLVAVREECAPSISERLGPFALTVSPAASQAEIDRLVDQLRARRRAISQPDLSPEEEAV